MLLSARPYASVLMVVNPDTASRLVESVSFLLNEGCRYVIVSLNYAAAWGEAELEELARQYERLGDLYIEWTRQRRKFYLSPFEVKLSSHIQGEDVARNIARLAFGKSPSIPRAASSPASSSRLPGRRAVGASATSCQASMRRSDNQLREESQNEKEPCRQCSIRRRCHNTCGCLNWQTTGTVSRVSPVLCAYEQILIPIADRIGETLYREQSQLFLNKHYNPAYSMLSLLEDMEHKGDRRDS